MTNTTLAALSHDLAQLVDSAAPSVVQIHGHRRPASGVAISKDAVLTTMRVVGREEGVKVRTSDGQTADAGLVGWDPVTSLAVLRTPSLALTPAEQAADAPRVGQLAIALGRSWSNAITATLGLVSVIGGPLRTGRRSAIEQVLRTSAPMHDGFSGGALLDAAGRVLGINTSTSIRGLQVVIPASIAWAAASQVLEHGRPRRGFVGLAGQAVALASSQKAAAGVESGMLVVAVTPGAAADQAGIVTGDVLLQFEGKAVTSADDLIELLNADAIGRACSVRLLRGTAIQELSVTVGERR
jgi:S1-C subfamily serine protease